MEPSIVFKFHFELPYPYMTLIFLQTKPLVECLFQACQDFGYDAAKFIFDGEPVQPRKTPIELDLEEGDCFDIVEQT